MKNNINQILDKKKFIFLLIGLSFIIRTLVIYIYHDNRIEQEWEILLYNLIAHKSYSYYGPPTPHVMLPPLYPFFLYFLNILTFDKISLLNTIIFSQIILSTISVYLFYKINLKIFSNKISFINSYIFSFFPLNVYAAGQTSSITLQVFLSMLFLLFLFNLNEYQKKKKIIFFSLASGLLILTRGEFILIYLFTLFYLLIKNKINLKNIIIISLCTSLVLSPYLIRNYYNFNQIFIVKALGFNLWKGNNELSSVEGYGDFNLDFYNYAVINDIENPNYKNPIFKDINDKINASVPEAQPTEYLIFEILENSFSKIFTEFPRIKSFFLITEKISFLITLLSTLLIGLTSEKLIILVILFIEIRYNFFNFIQKIIFFIFIFIKVFYTFPLLNYCYVLIKMHIFYFTIEFFPFIKRFIILFIINGIR